MTQKEEIAILKAQVAALLAAGNGVNNTKKATPKLTRGAAKAAKKSEPKAPRIYNNDDINVIEYHKPVMTRNRKGEALFTGKYEEGSKSILVYGDGTYPVRDKLKEVGASFGRRFLVNGEYVTGWCINNKEGNLDVNGVMRYLGIGSK